MSICECVCILVMFVSRAKTAEPIEMPFRRLTRMGPRNHVFGCGARSPWEMGNFGVVRPIEKHCDVTVALYAARQSIKVSERLFCSGLQCWRLVSVTLHSPPVKNPSPAMRPLVKFFGHSFDMLMTRTICHFIDWLAVRLRKRIQMF